MKKSVIVLFALILFMSFSSAYLGTYKQNDEVTIRVLSNCSSVNLIEVASSNNVFIINSAMTNLGGQTFNYTFHNISDLGDYSYSWNPSCTDCSQDNCGNSFGVTPNGQLLDISRSILYCLIIIILLGILSFCIYSLMHININEEGTAKWQIFYLCLGYLMLFVIMFILWIFSKNYLWDIPMIASVSYTFWIILGALFLPYIIIVSAIILKREALDRLTKDYISQGYSKQDSLEMAKSHRR